MIVAFQWVVRLRATYLRHLARSLEWIATAKLQASAVIHILDDFLFLAPSRDKCHRDLDNFIKLCNEVGVPIIDEKTVGPATCLQFARITLDTIVTLHGVSRNKVNARTRHVITRSHANGMTRLPCGYVHENN